jgi:hypothetical protein
MSFNALGDAIRKVVTFFNMEGYKYALVEGINMLWLVVLQFLSERLKEQLKTLIWLYQCLKTQKLNP